MQLPCKMHQIILIERQKCKYCTIEYKQTVIRQTQLYIVNEPIRAITAMNQLVKTEMLNVAIYSQ